MLRRTMLKINAGCGNMPSKDWKNIDLFYYPGTAELHPDHGKPEDYDWEQADFTTYLAELEENSVDEIWFVHSLEHTYWEGAEKALKDSFRCLKPDCPIEVEVPDLDAVFDRKFDNRTMIGLVYGGWDSNTILLGHACGFTRDTLREMMEGAGFKDIEEVEVGFGTSKPEPDRNFRLRGVK